MQHTVFISHAHSDNALCDSYAIELAQLGLDVWYDRTNMELAQVIGQSIGQQLKERSALVVLLTPDAVKSGWVTLETQVFLTYWTQEPEKRLVLPVMLKECDVPPLLRPFNRIDVTLLGHDEAVQAIARTLGVEPPSRPTEPALPVTTTRGTFTGTPDEAVILLDTIMRLIVDWTGFTEEKWRTVSDSQLGWKPLRGRWNGWEEIYQDSFGVNTNGPMAQAAEAASEAMARRFNSSREKGTGASAVVCFLRDLETLRQTLVMLTEPDVAGAPRWGDIGAQQPITQRTGKSPIIRNPMIVDAD